MRIPSGKTDQSIYFVAYDSTDMVTRKTGLSAFTVYRSRNGAAPVVYAAPTISEVSAANMPGIYALLINADTTIASTSDSEEYSVHITCATMAPVSRTLELYRRDTTSGNQLLVDANGRVDVIKLAGTTQTARDIGASVLLSAGTGTGQLDFTSGVVKSNLVQILGTVLTETAGQIAAAFKKVFDVAAPVFTAQSVNQTGDSFARIGVAGAGLTNLGDTRIANLDATVSSRLASASYTAPDNATITLINNKTTNLPVNPAATTDIPTANQNADALLDRVNGVETGFTPRQTMRLMSAVLCGKSTGHPGSPVYRNMPDTADRLTATVSSGNRSAVTQSP
jgi:hypothetical protein